MSIASERSLPPGQRAFASERLRSRRVPREERAAELPGGTGKKISSPEGMIFLIESGRLEPSRWPENKS